MEAVTTSEELAAALVQLSAEQLSVAPAQLVRDASLAEDLGLDSLAAIEWGMAIEDAFGISLPEDVMEHVTTYGDVQALVQSLAQSLVQPPGQPRAQSPATPAAPLQA